MDDTAGGLPLKPTRKRPRPQRAVGQSGRSVAGAIAAGAVSLTAIGAQAATITVNSLADDTTAGNAQCTLREALANANTNTDTTGGDCVAGSGTDTINLTALAGTITLGGTQLPISDSTTITGPGAGTLTIDAANNSRVFYIYNNASALNVTISGVTITRGRGTNGGNIVSKGETVTLQNVALTSGVATTAGGGVANLGGTLSIQSSTISGNTAQGTVGGGGIYNVGGALTITGSTITANNETSLSGRGGGISILSTTQPTNITNSQITNNTATGKGAAVAVRTSAAGGTLTIDHSVITGNTANGRGGAFFLYRTTGAITLSNDQINNNTTQNRGGGIFLYNVQGNVTISDTTVSGNQAPTAAGNGGGIFLYKTSVGVTVSVQRSTISGNAVARAGGGIFLYKGSGALQIENSTIANNTAGTNGGALFDRGPFAGTATLDIHNSTIAGNTAATSGGNLNVTLVATTIRNTVIANGTAPTGPDATTGASNVTMNYSLLENTSGATFTGTGNITGIDPNLGPLQDNGGPTFTERPNSGSPLLDAGDPAFVPPPATDQRGLARVFNGRIDIGSLEQGAQSAFTFSSAGATVGEGAGSVTLTVNRSSGEGTASVNYATSNGSAQAGADYTATSGTLTFAAGDFAPKTITVPILEDTIAEPNEFFNVVLSAPGNATLGSPSTETVTITDNDPTPSLSINGVAQAEGNSGTSAFNFVVTLSNPSSQTVTANYATSAGTATAGSDYTSQSGTLTFSPGTTVQTIPISVLGDTVFEGNETFNVTLSAPTNATLGTASATGTIVNDDTAPSLSIGNVTQAEGNSGTTNFVFPVTLSAASGQTTTVNYTTVNGSATAGSDYTTTSGTLTFTPGTTTQNITVPVIGDTVNESDETFTVVLSAPANASIASGTGTGTITNDDAVSAVSIGNVSQAEGNSGSTTFTFPVTLSSASGQTVTVNYATADGTANAGSDYTATSGTVTFAPGETSKSVTVTVNGDTTSEPNETFTVTLASPVNATLGTATGTGTIVDDDSAPALAIGSITQAEGNSGTTTFSFPVTLSSPSGQTVTVNYATANGSAVAGSDYGATSGTLTFAPGVTSQTVNVPVTGDITNEADETFTVTLSAPVNAVIATATGTGTIVNDDPAPALSIADASQAEGNSGSSMMPFAVTLSAPSEQTITVGYSTANGSAVAGSDYTATSGTLTFAPGVTTQTINVPIQGDVIAEPDETFAVALNAPVNAAIADGNATGTIVNDDALPTVSIGNVSQAEGNSGTSAFTFAVTLSAPSSQTVTVNYATSDGTANAGSDYTATTGTVTFAPGVTSQSITVPVTGDTTKEPDETYHITLSGAVNATVGTAVGTGTIVDDDSAPALAISNVSQAEGNSGTTTFTFTVTLSAPSGQTVTVNYATANGTATAGSDYGATSGTLTFAPGVTSQTINVPVTGDTTNESDETFTVTLSSASNAPIATATGTGTIVNDDAPPALTIADASQAEGNSGSSTMPFVVMLSTPSEQAVTVNYTTANGTAVAGSDYTATSGTLTFAPGVTVQSINVPISGDTTSESDETFTVTLSSPVNALIADASATGTIVNDDSGPTVSIDNVTQAEGNSGSSNFTFTVTLSASSERPVTVDYTTANGSATAGSDYVASSGTVTFAPGQTSQTIAVAVLGDTTSEPNETFTVTLQSPTNATLGSAVGTGTIVDDDTAPVLTIGNVSQAEGDSGATSFVFTVNLSAPSGQTVTVNYATANGTAIAGSDYGATSGTLTFAPGVTSQTISVPVTGDTTNEANETFTVTLSGSTNAAIATATGTGTIINDDSVPSLSIAGASQTEGNSGLTNMPFTVTLSAPSQQTVTVNYATSNGSAVAGSDYTATTGTLTFAPGVTTQPINIPIVGDTTSETNETFSVTLSGASNASIATGSATGTIVNDDAGPAVSIGNVSQAEGNSGSTNFLFNVTLSAPSEQTVTVHYATVDGSAHAGSDYTATSGTLTFTPGVTSQSVAVPVSGDTTSEPTETFTVTLSSPVNAMLGTATGTGTIVDDDGAPVLSIGNVSRAEGNSGTTTFSFPVTLSAPSGQTVTVSYATANGTAIAGSDYGATSGTLTFAPGETAHTIDVPVTGDVANESDETFTVTLTGSTNAAIATATGTGTIVNDDAGPALTISDASQPEGNSGTTNMTFNVTLAAPSEQTVTVSYATANGTATAGSDYTATSGTLTFAPGVTVQTIQVPVAGDTTIEPDETLFVNLSGATNATIIRAQGTGTIVNDDGAFVPAISVSDISVPEGDGGTTPATFTVTLSAPTTATVTVDYATSSGTAQSGVDFAPTQGTLVFTPGTTSRTVTVGVIGDLEVEPSETFTLDLSAANGATIARGHATATIVNDDSVPPPQARPLVGIADARVTEGNHGLTDATVIVTLSAPSATDVTVDYATSDGTATAGADYASLSGSVVIPAGTTSRAIHIPVVGDTLVEGDESFHVRLSSPNGATLAGADALVTIVDDDTAAAPARGYLPIAGATPGAFGSLFRTTLQLHNPGDAPSAGQLIFRPQSGSTPATIPYTLAPHETKVLDDAALLAGIGTIDFISTSGATPLAVARITSASACGTVGLATGSLDARDALTPNDRAILLAPTDLGTASRFNVGIRPLENGATIRFTLRDAAGRVKTQVERSYPASSLRQTSAADLLATAVSPDDSVLVEVTAGSAIVYASTTDNSSQDPALQIARPLP